MSRLLTILFLFATLSMASGCAYVNTRTPFDENLDNTDLGTKTGEAHNYSLLWLVAWGDGGYAEAARNGGITVLKHADQQIEQFFFGAWYKRTIIVYGD